jgi:D-arabinose 1-dehydrogenase-like Zn-dependent alcohol dehydrogenase
MRAVVVPHVKGKWEVRDVTRPEPGPGEVLVRVRASGICYTDVWSTIGQIPVPFPSIMGHETAGEIAEVGVGVSSRQVGDRVGITWVLDTCGRCGYCRENRPVSGLAGMNCAAPRTSGFSDQGGHAEYMAVPAGATVLLPDALPFELAAPVCCAGYTTWSALRDADPKPHERVAILGIGGLGHMAVQFAKAAGFVTIAVTHSPDKRDLARRLGADIVVSDGRELKEAGGADIILMTGNSNQIAMDSLRGLRPDGRLILVGLPFGEGFTIPAPGSGVDFVMARNRVQGTTHGGFHLLHEALEFVASGAVTPMVETFPVDKAADAYERVASGKVRFRAVLTH